MTASLGRVLSKRGLLKRDPRGQTLLIVRALTPYNSAIRMVGWQTSDTECDVTLGQTAASYIWGLLPCRNNADIRKSCVRKCPKIVAAPTHGFRVSFCSSERCELYS